MVCRYSSTSTRYTTIRVRSIELPTFGYLRMIQAAEMLRSVSHQSANEHTRYVYLILLRSVFCLLRLRPFGPFDNTAYRQHLIADQSSTDTGTDTAAVSRYVYV